MLFFSALLWDEKFRTLILAASTWEATKHAHNITNQEDLKHRRKNSVSIFVHEKISLAYTVSAVGRRVLSFGKQLNELFVLLSPYKKIIRLIHSYNNVHILNLNYGSNTGNIFILESHINCSHVC